MIATKWPRLLVVGDPVSPERADEIIVRTTDWDGLYTNDPVWEGWVTATLVELLDYPALSGDRWSGNPDVWRARAEWRERNGVLDLTYLRNERVSSAWFGGPHGWIDWDGYVGCATYNVGKWPSDETITEDWRRIAAAFPDLRLTAQLVEDEGEGALAGEWRVADGFVTHVEDPVHLVREVESVRFRAFDGLSERGCSLPRLRDALRRVGRTTP